MARTYRKTPYNFYTKEKKRNRKTHYRAIRKAAKRALHDGMEPGPAAYKTSGWLTW